jgi:tellurite resistance protein TehA-like permease
LQEFRPFLKGFTVFFWAAATWWIPFLIALMGWRYLFRRDRLRYEPQLWAMVFPLGMYTTGTFQLSQALDLPFLAAIPRFTVFIALAAWIATFCRLLMLLARAVAEARQRPTP